jgi:hypothetical protein
MRWLCWRISFLSGGSRAAVFYGDTFNPYTQSLYVGRPADMQTAFSGQTLPEVEYKT